MKIEDLRKKYKFLSECEIACNDGWAELIANFANKAVNFGFTEHFNYLNIKEKFGGLRINFSFKDSVSFDIEFHTIFSNYILRLEQLSTEICEICSADNAEMYQRMGWYKTLCHSCAKNNQYEIRPKYPEFD